MLDSDKCQDFRGLFKKYIFICNIGRQINQEEYSISVQWQIECKAPQGDRNISKYATNLHFSCEIKDYKVM